MKARKNGFEESSFETPWMTSPTPKNNWDKDVQTAPRCEGITGEEQADIRNKTVPTALQTFNALLMRYLVELNEAHHCRARRQPGNRTCVRFPIKNYQPQFNFITSTTFAFGTTGIFTAV